jgi:predicted RNA-binding protein with PIN domain
VTLLIDGHNLIGAGVFPDIRLSDEDDEAKLVARLKVWRSRHAGTITVVFDRGIAAGREPRLGGAGVEVIFAADPLEADDLIRRRLRRHAPGLTLVTNDQALLREAERYGVAVLRGREFVERMTLGLPEGDEPGTDPDVRLTPAEVENWLAIFRRRKRHKPRTQLPPSGQNGSEPRTRRKPGIEPSPKNKRGKPSRRPKGAKARRDDV